MLSCGERRKEEKKRKLRMAVSLGNVLYIFNEILQLKVIIPKIQTSLLKFYFFKIHIYALRVLAMRS
jgi:hypothetical protein